MNKEILKTWFLAIVSVALFCASGCSKQAKADRHLKRANAYLAAGDYEKAEIEYLNVFRLNPTNTLALRNLANIYFEDDLSLRAAAFFNSLQKFDPSDLESRAKLSRVYLSGGALKEARDEALVILKNSPTNQEAVLVLVESAVKPEDLKELPSQIAMLRQRAGDKSLFHLADGLIALRDKKTANAEAEFKKAIALDPRSAAALSTLGSFYLLETNVALAEPAFKAAADLSPVRSLNHLRLAALKLQTNDTNAANSIINAIVAKAPDYTPAWMFKARIALSQKAYDQCAAALQRVITRTPDNFEAISLRAEMYMAQSKPDKAIDDLERLSAQYPKSPQARYQLALAQLKANEINKAAGSVRQAVALDRNFIPATLLLAELNIRSGDAGAAISSLTDLLKRDTKIPRAFMLLATAYQSTGKFDDALAVYNSGLKQFPQNTEMYFMSGVMLRLKGNIADARKIFESIVKARPDDPQANAQLVELDITAKNFAPAAQRMQNWIARAPENPEPRFQMAKIFLAQSDFKAAQEHLEKVISMNPDAIGAYVMLARAYYAMKQSDAALEKFQQALSRNPRDIPSLLMVGIINDEKHDFEHSREAYEKLLAIAPRNPAALNNLAVIYAEHFNQLDKAYTLARQANELRPEDGSIADTLGWILVKRGDYGLALPPLRLAAQANATDPEVTGHLGIAQYLNGDEAAARATLTRALSLATTFNGRDQVEKSLAILNIDPAAADKNAVSVLQQRLSEKPADLIALSRLATIYLKSGQFQEAANIYQTALSTNPKLAIAAARLADLNDLRLSNPAKAIELAKNARSLDAENPEIAHIAGRIASNSSDLKDVQWGLGLLQESSKERSDDPTIAYDLAWAFLVQGRLSDAENAAKIALNSPATAGPARQLLDFLPLIDPARAAQNPKLIQDALRQSPDYLPALAANAALAQQTGDTPEALQRWDQILSRYPAFAPALRNVSILAAENPANPSKAVGIASRARDLYPDDFEVAKALGILQYQAGDFNKSIRTLEPLTAKRSNDASIQYFIGMAHYKLKETAKSKAALQTAIRLQPKPSYLAEAQRVLAELK